MKKYAKEFLWRGLVFGGFGPIILGIIFFILDFTIADFSLGGKEVFIGIISTYILAFIQAGASIFNQIEHWPITKSLFFHMGTVYLAYLICYLINSWIPFEINVVLIFTAIFAVSYLVIWFTVYFVVKATEKRLNRKLNEKNKK